MALDFPNSPTAGTVFGAWRYDGTKWGAVSGVSGGGSAGDITAVLAGAGLSGGGTEGDVSIALAVPVTVARGGTGATDAVTALTNLGGAPLASPTFTGDPKAPTPATSDNDTSVATTAYVKAQGYQTGNQTITLSGDASGSGTTAITTTLATVNANVGTFQGLTVNGKGLVTAAANQSYLTSPVNLTSQVAGTLPVANGGTGGTTQATARTGIGAAPLTRGAQTATLAAAVTMGVGWNGMLGLGSTFTVTPVATGVVFFSINTQMSTNAVGGIAVSTLRIGTGTPPAKGAAATGTAISQVALATDVANQGVPVVVCGVVTGLTPGSAYWYDLQVASSGTSNTPGMGGAYGSAAEI